MSGVPVSRTWPVDPFRGYASALTDTLPRAIRVLDCFHVTRLAFAAVDRVRRRVQPETTGRRGRRHDPLYGIRRLLLRRADHLSPTTWTRLLSALELADVDQQIGRAFIAAQQLHRIYHPSTGRRRPSGSTAGWCSASTPPSPSCAGSPAPIDTWEPELLAYFDTHGVSSGPAEAVNL